MSRDGKEGYGDWVNKNRKTAQEAREIISQMGASGRNAVAKYLLLKAQGFECIYFPNGSLNVAATGQALADSKCIYTQEPVGISNLDDLVIDHIVPLEGGYNGPDSFLNKVVTTRHVNERMKKCRTPYEWFQQDMPELWEAYAGRIKKHVGTLGRKKVKLLTQADASDLVNRYTALAETAWISKLAQAILCIHFGWNFSLDEERKRKITVVSGGLTARIRRKYKLNSLLARDAATEEEAEKKNRKDDRHHALDAMVINFIPDWARNPEKEHFFRFPEGVNRETFRRDIAKVMPQSLAFQKARLAETIYGGRAENGNTIIVQRVPLVDLAYNTKNQKKFFDFDYLRDQTKTVRHPMIAEALHQFLADGCDEERAWRDFCDKFYLPKRDGSHGPRVIKLNVRTGDAGEYANLAKDKNDKSKPHRGAFRKGKKEHKGQIVYIEKTLAKKSGHKEIVHVRPVYAFESRAIVERKLREEHGDAIRLYGFFQSGCLIAVEREVAHDKVPLPAGTYLLNTIRTGGDVKLTTQDGKTHPEIPRYSLKNLIAAGLRRSD